MKITILFLALIALGFSVKAQRMALADNKTHGTTAASASTPIPAKTPQFVFTNYGIDLNHADLKEYPQHFLGDRIARKLYATQKVYVRRHTATVGFTDNTMEIYKPAIYNSVMKLDSYFKGSQALVTTYTYSPFFGLTLKTDPNGNITHYNYDEFGRLKSVTDRLKKTVQNFEYHYKNQ